MFNVNYGNPYYNPEGMGLEIVGILEDNIPYEFNMAIVWVDDNDNLFFGEDSGCSCPTPFDECEPQPVPDLGWLKDQISHWPLEEVRGLIAKAKEYV